MKDRAGADSALECVGTQELMKQAIHLFRRGRIRVIRGRSQRRQIEGERAVLCPCPSPWRLRASSPFLAEPN